MEEIQYLVGKDKKPRAIVIPIDQWEKILEQLEDIEDIRAYDEAKLDEAEPIDFRDAVNKILAKKSS